MRKILYAVSLLLPWAMRRYILCTFLKFEIHPTCHIGRSWILPDQLIMKPYSRIGHLTLCKGIMRLQMEEYSSLGNANWITGYPKSKSDYFSHQSDREPVLEIGAHAAITHRHLIDCTNRVVIGPFATVAGYHSQMLTHSIDLEACRQSSSPITIGEYCFVGTNSVLLGGSALPPFSVLGAKSMLNKSYTDEYWLYGGGPARPIQPLDRGLKYFCRPVGHVK